MAATHAIFSVPPLSPERVRALGREAWPLLPVPADERKHLLRDEAAFLVDRLLVQVARSSGAIAVATGECLASLRSGDGPMRLGYSSIGDYAREHLSLAPRTALELARLARELRERPLLREAVRSGEVSFKKAEAVLPVAKGDAEVFWVARARRETVNALLRAARGGAAPGPKEEAFDTVRVELEDEERATVDRAMGVAGQLLGAASPRWQRLEAMCQEFLGAHPEPDGGGEAAARGLIEGGRRLRPRGLAGAGVRAVELPLPGRPCPGAGGRGRRPRPGSGDRRAAPGARGHAPGLGRAARPPVPAPREHRPVAGHAVRRPRALRPRAARDVGAAAHPPSDAGGEAGVRAGAARGPVRVHRYVDAWIEIAKSKTCIELKRLVEADAEGQLCARKELELRVPEGVRTLFSACCRVTRAGASRTLVLIAEHFIATWGVRERRTKAKRVIERDHGWCTVPGCSRPAVHSHHITYRSHGGGDEEENQTGICLAHHLHGIHEGYVRVRGRAPDALVWELGEP